MMQISDLPKYHDFFRPVLQVLEGAGGSASINEINDAVVESMGLPSEALDIWYESGAGAVVPDRISWARSYLKSAGLLESPSRGVWLLTESGKAAISLDEIKLKASVALANKPQKKEKGQRINPRAVIEENPDNPTLDWRDELLEILRVMDPSAFERLARRLLLASGFVNVEVTGKTGDGGIDGKGILQLSLMSFHVLFQCKRYQGSVGSGAVRDFRGAMMGRTDKGLIITTGTFSPDARREATRDGAPPIDLIDGLELCEFLKEKSLGVETKLVEEITIKPTWFDQI